MKIGIRTPNLKSRIKAKTTGKIKRTMKKAVDPLYGNAGVGWIKDPKKALYNKIYRQTTVGVNLNFKTRSGKEIQEYDDISVFLSDVDIDTISMTDIDEMEVEALEIIYNSNKDRKMSKENKMKLQRISSKIILKDIVPNNLVLDDHVRTKSGKTRHEFPSDYRYLADLDLSTLLEETVDSMDLETLSALYSAKKDSWKRKNEKSIFKKIENRYIEEIFMK